MYKNSPNIFLSPNHRSNTPYFISAFTIVIDRYYICVQFKEQPAPSFLYPSFIKISTGQQTVPADPAPACTGLPRPSACLIVSAPARILLMHRRELLLCHLPTHSSIHLSPLRAFLKAVSLLSQSHSRPHLRLILSSNSPYHFSHTQYPN